MPRSCTVCAHDESHVINVALVSREPYRDIARRFGVSKDALKRHSGEHIPKLLVEASRAMEVCEADGLLGRIEGLHRRTLAVLETAEESGELRTALAAIREARGTLELVGRITKELDERPVTNVLVSPEWLELRTVTVTALEPHSDALRYDLRALSRTEAEGGKVEKRLHAAPEWP